MTVLKPSDVELHRIAADEAAKHGATFEGPAETYKYGVFRLDDGRTIELHLYHVRDGKWPQDIDQFIIRQAKSRGRNREKMLSRLNVLAASGEATCLDKEWEGPHFWYSFRLKDGRVVQIRGSKLMTSGWPADVDAYLRWSADRRQGETLPKTNAELFDEFKAEVARNNGVVLATNWLGSRTPHDVLLSDGTIRKLKPNQLKYFGWPVVPLDELRKMASPYPVHILPDTAHSATQVFRIVLNAGVFLEGSAPVLKALWDDGVAEIVAEAALWADSQGLVMVPAKWHGILEEYAFIAADGTVITRRLPHAEEHEARRINNLELAKLRRIGTMQGAKLISDVFTDKDAEYTWERDGVRIQATARQLIQANQHRSKFEKLKQRVADLGLKAELLSTDWQGMCAPYRWRLDGGREVTAKFSQLRQLVASGKLDASALLRKPEAKALLEVDEEEALEILRDWATGVGITLLSTDWVDHGADYEWELPDGSVVRASVKKVRNCTRAVFRRRDEKFVDTLEEFLLKPEECDHLKWRISVSKSR